MHYYFGYLDIIVYQVMSPLYFATTMACYSMLVLWRLFFNSSACYLDITVSHVIMYIYLFFPQ